VCVVCVCGVCVCVCVCKTATALLLSSTKSVLSGHILMNYSLTIGYNKALML